jgi:hypothetical protein
MLTYFTNLDIFSLGFHNSSCNITLFKPDI